MISVSGKSWFERKVSKNSVEKIKQDFSFTEILSRLIITRNFDLEEINNISNEIKINNEFVNNKDFIKAADLLIYFIKNNENICILGDYDVDGSAATALLVRFFNFIKQPHFFYIPDREKDGYGASKKLFEKLILKKPKLVIMVDCGSSSNEAIEYLKLENISTLVIDHHEINKPFPKSDVIINPKKNDGYIKYDYLCATALTYFFLDILIKKLGSKYDLSEFLIFVLLASVCDVMPLRKLNRIIAINVLKNFDIKKNISFNSLFDLSNKIKKINIDNLSFFIGPIINSGGRLGKSSYGTELLTSDDINIVSKKSVQLIKLNNQRKIIESNILDEINFDKIQKKNENVIIYYNPNINEGLIGIIAARLKDYFNKPSIVITKSNYYLKGSARSTINYNIGHVVKRLLDKKIINSGGGHSMAAGFSLEKNKIRTLEKFIFKDYSKHLNNSRIQNLYDLQISSSFVNKVTFAEVYKLGPFGTGNELPIFFLKDLKIIKITVLSDKHISALLKTSRGSFIKSICFNCIKTQIGKYLLSYKKNINVIGQLQENFWNNKKTLQLNIKDIIL
jgi:single-stranded-DNA-specific exonuclease